MLISNFRAVYSDSEIYLLDDPLSAVDSHVGKHIFEKVISHDGLLSNKTRVLVTHGITYLPKADHIIVMKDGKVSEQGSYDELLNQKGEFANFLLEYMTEIGEEDADVFVGIRAGLEEALGKKEFSKNDNSIVKSDDNIIEVKEAKHKIMKQKSRSGSISDKNKTAVDQDTNADNKKATGTTLIEEENIETGNVQFRIYKYYAKKYGIFGTLLTIFGTCFYQGSNIGTNYWLNIWSNDSLNTYDSICYPNCTDFYLGIYGVFGAGQMFGTMFLSLTILLSGNLTIRQLQVIFHPTKCQ